MARSFQPALFDPAAPAISAPISERVRDLALIANAATIETARMVASIAGLAWWDAAIVTAGGNPDRLPAPPSPVTTIDLPAPVISDAKSFGRDLAALPPTEANALLGRLYTHALPAAHRATHGVFYTPRSLVSRLLAKAEAAGHQWSTARVIDPACGAGAFLVQAAERMAAALPNVDPAIQLASVSSRLKGWEIDPFAAWLAQLSTELALLPRMIACGRRLRPLAEVADALVAFSSFQGSWDLVMGNPPFGKIKDTPHIRARFHRSLHGHPNLYGMFVDLAVHLAKPETGIIAFLTPASFLGGRYFRNLRRLLRDQAPPISLDLVDSRADVFEDVLQEVTLSVLRRGGSTDVAECAVVRLMNAELRVEQTGTVFLPANPDEPWKLPRTTGDAGLIARLHAMPARLADWGYGVSTGPLVWNRHKSRLHDTKGPGRVPVVWAEAVTPDGRFELKATKKNHRGWFEPRDATDPNLVDKACVLVQRTTAKEQHRRLIAAEMPASLLSRCKVVAVENHLNMIRPIVHRPKVPLSVVAAFLATDTADRVLRCINASVAVSASELAAMPLPSADTVTAAAKGPDFAQAIRKLYGLGSK